MPRRTTSATTDLGERLRWLRLRAGMEQREVAEALGVDVNRYGQWERGHNAPPCSFLLPLCGLLGVRVGYLLGEAGGREDEAARLFGQLAPENQRAALGLIRALLPPLPAPPSGGLSPGGPASAAWREAGAGLLGAENTEDAR